MRSAPREAGAEVSIYDEIGAYGVSAKAFIAELGALPEDVPLTLRLNSPGGSVFDSVAIYNALKRHGGPVAVWIDGIAASAASYVAMAGDEVVMPANAFIMIHDPGGMVLGTAADMRAMADALDKIKGSLVAGYAAKSGRDEAEIAALMAKESWFDAEETVALGLADRLAEPVRIAARFDIGRFRNAPPALVAAMAADDEPEDGAEDEDEDEADEVGEAEENAGDADPQPAGSDPPREPAGADQPDPAAVRAEALAHARAVIDLCRLAGLPQMAGSFLERETSLDEVRAALLSARAETAPEVDPHHPQPGSRAGAQPWGGVIARTFKRG